MIILKKNNLFFFFIFVSWHSGQIKQIQVLQNGYLKSLPVVFEMVML